jgi:hypothetical protein
MRSRLSSSGPSSFIVPAFSRGQPTYYAICRLLHGIQRRLLNAQLRSSEAPERSPGVRHVTVAAQTPDLQNASQLPQMEDFAVTCPLVPDASRLISGFCSSPRSFGLGFLQTPPRDDALALLLAFGSAKTWLSDFHRHSYVPCPAHTSKLSRRPWLLMAGRLERFVGQRHRHATLTS